MLDTRGSYTSLVACIVICPAVADFARPVMLYPNSRQELDNICRNDLITAVLVRGRYRETCGLTKTYISDVVLLVSIPGMIPEGVKTHEG